jgi:GTPase
MFIDAVKMTLSAGKGGNGIVAWRREKFIPKGGPAGGNGGRGGAIVLRTTPQLFSLEHFRNRRHICAENGASGGTNQQQGRSGKDLVLEVPCGTLVKDAKTQEILFDLKDKDEQVLICRGGRGGMGNVCFKSPTHQAPNICTEGSPGEILDIELELKLIADVGLVGMPNAGKSTLMKAITYVPVKIAAYPFTTLYPNLSYVQFDDYSRILVADIPGIIKDAHVDKGLGLSFLRHIERTSILLFVIDVSGFEGRAPLEDYSTLLQEIREYNPALLKKPHLIVLNKIDAEEAEEQAELFRSLLPPNHAKIFEISALKREGLTPLLEALKQMQQITASESAR